MTHSRVVVFVNGKGRPITEILLTKMDKATGVLSRGVLGEIIVYELKGLVSKLVGALLKELSIIGYKIDSIVVKHVDSILVSTKVFISTSKRHSGIVTLFLSVKPGTVEINFLLLDV